VISFWWNGLILVTREVAVFDKRHLLLEIDGVPVCELAEVAMKSNL